MKKKNILIYVATAILIVALGIFGYIQFVVDHTPDDPTPEAFVNPFEHVVSLDKQKMFLINENYSYFETNYEFSGEVDTLITPDIVFVSNIFQTVSDNQPTVYFSRHYADGSEEFETKEGAFWLEDFDMSDAVINLTIEDAFDALQKANCPKPKSKYCTLRSQIGSIKTNPQYVFGNDNRGIVYVDAITGAVSTINPVFDYTIHNVVVPKNWMEIKYGRK